ncbi:hypothetical protein EV380_2626 [Zhihengliuella halotolerans]|uniref:Uncharacterized protein n=1 Tax=Zhihengliuella halotolerans TaxID=370736 RepID=A0A4Q8AH68_9MICC|nr:hypothetical protein EV380_2626 [Zhihengliuella halotolerans]
MFKQRRAGPTRPAFCWRCHSQWAGQTRRIATALFAPLVVFNGWEAR